MKVLMLTGAFVGFGIGFGMSWIQNSTSPNTFWHACVAAYIAALLMRWWGRLWLKSLRTSWEARQAAAEKAKTSPAPTK
jgi:hypothetical protein